jgi:lipoprotein-anchoring transpeptidase ErfK/SrfK
MTAAMKLAATACITALLIAVSGRAQADILIKVDKSAQLMTVIQNGEVVDRWPVSTGRSGYGTPSGSFKPFRMEADHHSDEWDDAPMPHSIFFTQKGHAIHGTYETRHLGSPVSHGCVRISAAHATALFAMVKSEGMSNTKVVVTGGGGEDLVARRNAPGLPDANDEPDWNARADSGVDTPMSRIFATPAH